MDERLDRYFQELVPAEGKAKTVAGEVVRALNKIAYRYYNDGDIIGVGYGKETCNPAARYLAENTSGGIGLLISSMWGECSESKYEDNLKSLIVLALDWVDSSDARNKLNTEDMLEYDDPEDYIPDEVETEYY